MGAIGLALYTITIFDKASDDYIQFDEPILQEPGALSVRELIDNFFQTLPGTVDRNTSRVFELIQFEQEDHHINNVKVSDEFTGIVESGDYGYTSRIKDVDSGIQVLQRQPNHAELLPFYFHISLPVSRNRGLVLLQSFKQFSIKGAFETEINKYFKSIRNDVSVNIKAIMPKEYVLRMIESGRILKMNFVRHTVPNDIADAVNGQAVQENEFYEEYTIKANPRKSLPTYVKDKLVGYFTDGQTQLGDLIELENFDYDELTIELEVNKKNKRIDLGNYQTMTPKFDITDEVTIGADGHPEYESIKTVSSDWRDQFASDIRLDVITG